MNVLYDFTDAFGPGFTPYVGAGVGWQYIRESNLEIFGLLPAGPSAGVPYGFRINSGTNTFAYQAIVGMAFSLASWVPGLDGTLEYRCLGTGGDRPTRHSSSRLAWRPAPIFRSVPSTTTPSWWASAAILFLAAGGQGTRGQQPSRDAAPAPAGARRAGRST